RECRSGDAEDVIRHRPDRGGEFRNVDRGGREFSGADYCLAVSAGLAGSAGFTSGWHLPLHTVSDSFCSSPSRLGSDAVGRRTLSVSTTEPSGFERRSTICCSWMRIGALLSCRRPTTVCAYRLV